jgi:hypothetical protein
MLDFDLALLYEVETKVLNQAVKRNAAKFPKDFMFKLTTTEWNFLQSQIVTGSENSNPSSQIVLSSEVNNLNMNLLVKPDKRLNRSQIVTSSQKHRGTTPYAFSEHGVTMLASVLKSKRAIDINYRAAS